MSKIYRVHRLTGPMAIDANWDKPQWQKVEPLTIALFVQQKPQYMPKTQAKLLYDNNCIYIIYRIEDTCVRAIETKCNGRVWDDSCVEFFLTPDKNLSKDYFNIEMNCIGTLTFRYQTAVHENIRLLEKSDCDKIVIATSLPKKVIDPEIAGPVTWTIECRLPLDILEKYRTIARPAAGVKWRANFYKCGDATSNFHRISWSYIEENEFCFHSPQFFGTLEFVD
ncbi:MAG TPA: carbohydrate-binding family 9-like protein [Methylococcales bacterium]